MTCTGAPGRTRSMQRINDGQNWDSGTCGVAPISLSDKSPPIMFLINFSDIIWRITIYGHPLRIEIGKSNARCEGWGKILLNAVSKRISCESCEAPYSDVSM